MLEEEKSKGHKVFMGKFEYFTRPYSAHDVQDDLYRSLRTNPVMPDGYRSGRWECPGHMAEQWLKDKVKEEICLILAF